MKPIPYFEFRDFPEGSEAAVQESLLRAVAGKHYILGPQLSAFEEEYARYLGAAAAIGVGNGYDALVLALKAVGVGPGDEVLVPAHTFIATLHAVHHIGAKPVLVEPDAATNNITAATAQAAITPGAKALVPVHLYGQVCDMHPLLELAQEHGLKVVEDAAQAHGARYQNRLAGTFGDAAAFSFYPTKNLGALGDGGAVVTNSQDVAAFVRMHRNYGETQKYRSETVGINSRLDELQAAVLWAKLPYLDQLNAERQRLAGIYLQQLQGIEQLTLPYAAPGCGHVFHIFSIRTRHRDRLQQHLAAEGIKTAIHYPVPVHLQPAYRFLGYGPGDFPVAEELARTSLSLPLFPGMHALEQERVVEEIQRFFR
ncbi:DegT/DnrJ/EryC1/StrS family aminotransferase [Pontibacter sp. CAU 1760]